MKTVSDLQDKEGIWCSTDAEARRIISLLPPNSKIHNYDDQVRGYTGHVLARQEDGYHYFPASYESIQKLRDNDVEIFNSPEFN